MKKPTDTTDLPIKLLRYRDLREVFGLDISRRHIDRLERQKKFPRRVMLGPRMARWVAQEVQKHMADLAEARHTQPTRDRRVKPRA